MSLDAPGDDIYVGTLGSVPWQFTTRGPRSGRKGVPSWQSLNYNLWYGKVKSVYLGDRTTIRYGSIHDILIDADRAGPGAGTHRVWMATNHGLILHDPVRTPRGFEIIPPRDMPLARLARTGEALYCGMPDGGLRVFDTSGRRWRPYGWENREPLKALAAWGDHLWVGAGSSLYVLEDAGASVRVVRKHALSTTSILADGDTLWVGTSSGILRQTEPPPHALAEVALPIRNTAVLYRHNNDLWAAEGPSLWRVAVSGKSEGAAPVRYDLTPFAFGHLITGICVVGDRLHVATAGGGMHAIALGAFQEAGLGRSDL